MNFPKNMFNMLSIKVFTEETGFLDNFKGIVRLPVVNVWVGYSRLSLGAHLWMLCHELRVASLETDGSTQYREGSENGCLIASWGASISENIFVEYNEWMVCICSRQISINLKWLIFPRCLTVMRSERTMAWVMWRPVHLGLWQQVSFLLTYSSLQYSYDLNILHFPHQIITSYSNFRFLYSYLGSSLPEYWSFLNVRGKERPQPLPALADGVMKWNLNHCGVNIETARASNMIAMKIFIWNSRGVFHKDLDHLQVGLN